MAMATVMPSATTTAATEAVVVVMVEVVTAVAVMTEARWQRRIWLRW